MSHRIANRMTLLSAEGAVVVVVCECGEKFRATSTDAAEKQQFQHMVTKERGQ